MPDDTINNGPTDITSAELEENISVEVEDIYKCFRRQGIHFLHINVRSLLPKVDELKIIASESKAAAIGVSETWLDDSIADSEVEIPNYNINRRNRNRHGGGVCLYIRSDLTFNPRPDLSMDSLETLWVEILLPKTPPIITGICYRLPKQNNFYDYLEQSCFHNNSFSEYECIMLGDFNI